MLRRGLEGTGPYLGIGLVLWLGGLVMFISVLMSANGWQWWMDAHSVQGHEQQGLVYYSVRGVNYTLDDPRSLGGGRPTERTVYYLSSDPGDGSLGNAGTEALDWGLTALPGAIGLLLIGIGFMKRYRRRRRPSGPDAADSFGHGLPAETVQALLSGRRQVPPQPRP